MTSREAIGIIKNDHCGRCDGKFVCGGCYIGKAIEALKMEVINAQITWERNIALLQLEEIGVGLGAKMDLVKEALEKQIPKKPCKSGNFFVINRCPECDKFIPIEGKYCLHCGQRLDWGESDERE